MRSDSRSVMVFQLQVLKDMADFDDGDPCFPVSGIPKAAQSYLFVGKLPFQ